ncbi:MAG: FMN-binding protein [Bacteroidales bacterium]|nr:FMN-binding protein [Bacteroidales bacterium]
MKILLILMASVLITSSDGTPLSGESSKKLNKTVTALFPESKIFFKKLNLGESVTDDTDILNVDGKWFEIRDKSSTLGWMFFDRVWGRQHQFEYVMFADTGLRIINITILNYPETHGTAITEREWLNKFNGLSPEKLPEYGKSVDAVSGATIFGSSLSESVSKSLKLLEKMKNSGLVK